MINLKLHTHKEYDHDHAVVIGGSLSGLMTAIALADAGINITVLEKSEEGVRSGAGLQVDGYSFNETEIEKKLKKFVSDGKSGIELWSSIESRLREQAHNNPNIDLNYSTRVESVDQDGESAWAKTEDGRIFKGDILIGADGHRSMVREKVAPNHPDAEFAGYVVWMASVLEDEIPEDKRPKASEEKVQMLNTAGGFLFGSVIEDEKGKRRIGCTWYDNTQAKLLNKMGAVEGKVVHHSIDGRDLDEEDLDELANQAKSRWPEPWRTATLHAIESRAFIGIPIKEYVPETLVNGRFALVGDAAHVPAPITASGFNESLKDAAVLSECASKGLEGFNAFSTLEMYESQRLRRVQQMVESGRSFTRSFGRY